ncbi:MAG: ATPase [Bacteroidales bacterium]|nr:ATPase [Candidatus Physcousia equi]
MSETTINEILTSIQLRKQLKLVVDSGSTKTTWMLLNEKRSTITSSGINPIRDNEENVTKAVARARGDLERQVKEDGLAEFLPNEVTHIHYYGAGCIPPYSTTVKRILQRLYPNALVTVESDMMGAAIALCGHNEGIACILGTGSNSCLFNGQSIVAQTPALGYILGDEGSGASLGKRLVGDVLKGQLPKKLQEAFLEETKLTQSEIINRVYRQPLPNLFLASLTGFLSQHIKEECIHALVVDDFRRFIARNITPYNRPDLPVNFVGGITASFENELREALKLEQKKMGRIVVRPIYGMADYWSA